MSRFKRIILICFDLSNMKTFTEAAEYFYPKIQENNEDASFVLVGDKSDLKSLEQLYNIRKFVAPWAKSHNINLPYFITSARSKQGIKTLFNAVADLCIRLQAQKHLPDHPDLRLINKPPLPSGPGS